MAKKHEEAKAKVLERYNQADDARKTREDKWIEFYNLYRSYLEDEQINPDGANLFVPYLFSVIETVVPRITDTLFAKRPYIKPLPRKPEDIEKAERLQVLLEYQIDKMNFKEKASNWIKEAVIYGTGIAKVYWLTKEKTVIEKQRVQFNDLLNLFDRLMGEPDMSMYEEVEKTVKAYDGPMFETVDIFDFYPDPYADSIENARYVVHKTMKPLNYVKEVYNPTEEQLKEIEEATGVIDDRENSPSERQSNIGMGNIPEPDSNMVEILEYWEDNKVITIANQEVVLRDEDNPFNHKKIPFIDICDTQVPKEFYGIGEIEPNKYLQNELNTVRNQKIDNMSMAINNMWAVVEGSGITEEDLISKPNGVIWLPQGTNVNEVLQPIGPQRVSPDAITEEATIKKDIQETTGATSYVKGIQPQRQATATEITTLQSEANYRFKQKIMNVITGLEKVGRMFVQLNKQYLESEQAIRIEGKQANHMQALDMQMIGSEEEGNQYAFAEISPEDIMAEFDIRIATTAIDPTADSQVKRQQLLEFAQILAQAIGGFPMELVKEISETYEIPNIRRLIEQIEIQQQRQQELEQQKIAAQMQDGGQTGARPPEQQETVTDPAAMMAAAGGGMGG